MPRNCRPWNARELAWLRENYAQMGCKRAARVLGRPVNIVRGMASRHKIPAACTVAAKLMRQHFLIHYRAGMNDADIAALYGLSAHAVSDVRKGYGLPPHRTERKDLEARAEVADLHAKGLNDQQIAAVRGTTATAVCKMRRALGLPANVPAQGGWRKRKGVGG